jgi:hypothetical protein
MVFSTFEVPKYYDFKLEQDLPLYYVYGIGNDHKRRRKR